MNSGGDEMISIGHFEPAAFVFAIYVVLSKQYNVISVSFLRIYAHYFTLAYPIVAVSMDACPIGIQSSPNRKKNDRFPSQIRLT